MDLRRKQEIVDWIRNNYPDSCFGINNKNVNVDEFFSADEITDYFYYEDLKLCGCGYPQYSEKLIMMILEKFSSGEYINMDNELDKTKIGLYDIVLKVLDTHNFTNHNGNVTLSFLTEKGKMYLDALKEKWEK